jgi:hypothetical protein
VIRRPVDANALVLMALFDAFLSLAPKFDGRGGLGLFTYILRPRRVLVRDRRPLIDDSATLQFPSSDFELENLRGTAVDPGGSIPTQDNCHSTCANFAAGKSMALLSDEKCLRETGAATEAARLAEMAARLFWEIEPNEEVAKQRDREQIAAELLTAHLVHGQVLPASRMVSELSNPRRILKRIFRSRRHAKK